jgi:hypothetical protein
VEFTATVAVLGLATAVGSRRLDVAGAGVARLLLVNIKATARTAGLTLTAFQSSFNIVNTPHTQWIQVK